MDIAQNAYTFDIKIPGSHDILKCSVGLNDGAFSDKSFALSISGDI